MLAYRPKPVVNGLVTVTKADARPRGCWRWLQVGLHHNNSSNNNTRRAEMAEARWKITATEREGPARRSRKARRDETRGDGGLTDALAQPSLEPACPPWAVLEIRIYKAFFFFSPFPLPSFFPLARMQLPSTYRLRHKLRA